MTQSNKKKKEKKKSLKRVEMEKSSFASVPVLLCLYGLLELVGDKSLTLDGGRVLWRRAALVQALDRAPVRVVRELGVTVRIALDGFHLGGRGVPLQRYLHAVLAERPRVAALKLHQVRLLVEGPLVQERPLLELPDGARGAPVRGQVLRVSLGLLVRRQLFAVQLVEVVATFRVVVVPLVLLALRLLPGGELGKRKLLLGETLQRGSRASAHVTSTAGSAVAPAASTQGLLLDR